MIKLITPKRDLYMDDDTSNPEGLFGKKGKFYEVEKSPYWIDICFTDERGAEHFYDLLSVDNDFWTVDFSRGFEFLSGCGVPYGLEGYKVFSKELPDEKTVYDEGRVRIGCTIIKEGGWTITRFSNQITATAPPKEISHPYANWKKDIGIAKFQRCIAKSTVYHKIVEGIKGYLDIENNLFYYHKKHRGQNTYLCCKVDRDYNVSFDMEFQFIRNNKDVGLVAYSSDILASFKFPEVDNSENSPSSWDDVISQYNKEQRAKEDEHKVPEREGSTWTDKHYDFSYKLTEADIEAGEIKIDPYFVSHQWKLGEKDNSGALWHCFKGIARFGEKNTVEREIKALHAQIKRLAEIRGVKL